MVPNLMVLNNTSRSVAIHVILLIGLRCRGVGEPSKSIPPWHEIHRTGYVSDVCEVRGFRYVELPLAGALHPLAGHPLASAWHSLAETGYDISSVVTLRVPLIHMWHPHASALHSPAGVASSRHSSSEFFSNDTRSPLGTSELSSEILESCSDGLEYS